jgi:PBP1b-binding outer membrane lipoprotein LpoB
VYDVFIYARKEFYMKRLAIIVSAVCLVFSSCAGNAPAQAQKSARELAIEQATPIRTEPATT